MGFIPYAKTRLPCLHLLLLQHDSLVNPSVREYNKDGIRDLKNAHAEPVAGYREVRIARPHQRRHARLHGQFTQDAYQPPAEETAGRRGERIYRRRMGYWV